MKKSKIGIQKTLFCPADSLVNRTHKPENEKEKKTNAIYGQKCLESFARFDRVGLWAKTFADLLIGTGDWYSTKSILTWKLSGTKCNRLFFQLVPKTHRTDATEFGLLPTPMTQTRDRTIEETEERQKKYGGKKRAMYLEHFATLGMLPTPSAMEGTGASEAEKGEWTGKYWKRPNGTKKQTNLMDVIKSQMLPTPQASEGTKITGKENQDSLTKRARQTTGKTSQLNPRFVGEMMGFPPNWTELPFQNGETNQ
jgi:hypothetical protein